MLKKLYGILLVICLLPSAAGCALLRSDDAQWKVGILTTEKELVCLTQDGQMLLLDRQNGANELYLHNLHSGATSRVHGTVQGTLPEGAGHLVFGNKVLLVAQDETNKPTLQEVDTTLQSLSSCSMGGWQQYANVRFGRMNEEDVLLMVYNKGSNEFVIDKLTVPSFGAQRVYSTIDEKKPHPNNIVDFAYQADTIYTCEQTPGENTKTLLCVYDMCMRLLHTFDVTAAVNAELSDALGSTPGLDDGIRHIQVFGRDILLQLPYGRTVHCRLNTQGDAVTQGTQPDLAGLTLACADSGDTAGREQLFFYEDGVQEDAVLHVWQKDAQSLVQIPVNILGRALAGKAIQAVFVNEGGDVLLVLDNPQLTLPGFQYCYLSAQWIAKQMAK